MAFNVKTIILFGGTSSERRVSVASAQHLHTIIPEADLWFWSTDGAVCAVRGEELMAHNNPYDTDFCPSNRTEVSKQIDGVERKIGESVVYLALHGGEGENGWLQARLEAKKIRFTGSGAKASAVAMQKSDSKDVVGKRGVFCARQLLFSAHANAGSELRQFQKRIGSIVIKPASDGSSAGLSFIRDQAQCDKWLEAHGSSSTLWLAEEELIGREMTVGVIMHGGMMVALPPSEVILEKDVHFDYRAKYHGVGNREITPAELSPRLTSSVQAVALIAHDAIGCFGYTRTDMIMTSSGIYYLETNTLPGMTKASFIPQQLRAAGIDLRSFVEGQIRLAMSRYD